MLCYLLFSSPFWVQPVPERGLPVQPVCVTIRASVRPPPQSSAVTLGHLSLLRAGCHHLNRSKGSGLSKRLSHEREPGFCFSLPEMAELREDTERTDRAHRELKTVLLNICQDNPSTGLRVLLLIYTIRREELESYHNDGEMVLCWLCKSSWTSERSFVHSLWTNSTDSARELFPAAALSKAGQSNALLSLQN